MQTDTERIEELEDELKDMGREMATAREELEQAPTMADLVRSLSEQECRRCHKLYIGHRSQRYCTRDCEMGWTPAPTYEQWYRTLHPDHDFGAHA